MLMAMLLWPRGPGVGFSTTVGGTSISITVISTEASGGVRVELVNNSLGFTVMVAVPLETA